MRFVVSLFLFIVAAACASTSNNRNTAALPAPTLEKIAEGVWVHKSWKSIDPWGPILSQGLVVKTDAGVFLVDTAWDDEDTEQIIELVLEQTGDTPKAAIVTHAHDDKMGGMATLAKYNIPTFAHALTKEDAIERRLVTNGDAAPGEVDTAKTIIAETFKHMWFDENAIGAFYPGPGHTRDNIVVYHPPTEILFAGCLIRPGASKTLGNTADADVESWADTVRNVAEEYPDAKIVIPSHGPWGGRALLDHTIALAEAANAE